MNLSRFFIDRPIFAGVISAFIFLAGTICLFQVPVSEYPDVVPPTVIVAAQFPGASPKTIAETVAAPIEEQINGVENMLYLSSQASSDGRLAVTVTFRLGTDPNLALQLVQNRVNQALPRLPEVTRTLGVTTTKSSPDLTLVVHLTSPNGRYDTLYLRNYANLNVKDQLARIRGVGGVQLFGSGDYAMRVWLNPRKIAERGLTPQEVVTAIQRQNAQVAAGVIGGPPYAKGVDLQLSINVQGRLEDAEQFGAIIVKHSRDGAVTRLNDVARVEIGAAEFGLRALLDNKSAVAIPIFQAPGANAIEISNEVRGTMARLKRTFPEGIDYVVAYDPTVFVRGSIEAVVHTLLEALALVVVVVIVFLQTWRASIIPLLAVPVSIVGTFAVMYLAGLSINTLTLFGLVLAIGIVVDDAIVVVENVERYIERGLDAREATMRAMTEVTSPIVAITLVLCAVFVPIAFISDMTGQFYRQFALTIAFSTIISAFNSLTLSPALAALLLKSRGSPKDRQTHGRAAVFGRFFVAFNRIFRRGAARYRAGVAAVLARKATTFGVYVMLLGAAGLMFVHVPPGFVPAQDKQYLLSFALLPNGATLDRTERVIRAMSEIALKEPGVASAVAFPGVSLNGFANSSSAGLVFVTLNPFDERRGKDLSAARISQRLERKFAGIEDAFTAVFPPSPVQGLGEIGGFKLQVEDRADLGYEALDAAMKAVVAKARQAPELAGVFTNYDINVPQLHAELDRTRAMQLGVDVQDVFAALQIYLGSMYVNDFNRFGRTYQVIAQADREFRARPDDILRLQTRNSEGRMVPLGSMLRVSDTTGPESAMRYNGFRSADFNGGPAAGYSSGQAKQAITRILAEALPKGMAFEWTDLAYQQEMAASTAIAIFAIALLLVFLLLAAKYESLFLPVAIILIVPMCLLSATAGVWLSGGDNNIFTQIGFSVLAGLACKNAILIVEFARESERRGQGTVVAAIEAARLRLRPILMTSLAFIMGVVPLVLSAGAGAEARQAMGVVVFSGMLGVTFFGLFLTPVFYVALRQIEKLVVSGFQGSRRQSPAAATLSRRLIRRFGRLPADDTAAGAYREKPADLPVRQGGRPSGPTDRTGLRENATGL